MEQKKDEMKENQDQALDGATNVQKKLNPQDLIGAQIKVKHQLKMDKDSFLIT